MDNKANGSSLVNAIFQIKKKSYSSVTKGKPILVTGKRKTTALTSVLVEGKDVTPKPLNQNLFTGGKERQLSVYEVSLDRHGGVDHKASHSTSWSAFKTQSTVRFKTDLDKLAGDIGSVLGGSISCGTYNDFFQANDLSIETEDSDKHSESIPSTEASEDEAGKMTVIKMPSHVSLILSETETFFVLNIPSSTVEKDTEEG